MGRVFDHEAFGRQRYGPLGGTRGIRGFLRVGGSVLWNEIFGTEYLYAMILINTSQTTAPRLPEFPEGGTSAGRATDDQEALADVLEP
jgi:hypothetical protein